MSAIANDSAPRVGVILVNWNGASETLACIDSLRQSSVPIWHIYVVDNASSDGSPETIRARHPDVTVLTSTTNLGYGGGFNRGAARALEDGAEFIWLLNNDTMIDADALEALLALDRRVGPVILSVKIRYQDNPDQLWYSGGFLDWRLKSYHREHNAESEQASLFYPVEWATGCSMFCSAEVARIVGPMDERFFLYLEDVDWCLRARRLSIPIFCAGRAYLSHGVSRSVSRFEGAEVTYYAWRNYYLLVRENGTWWQRVYAYADLFLRFVKTGLRLALFPSYRRDPAYMARTRGLVDFVLDRYGEAQPRADSRPSVPLLGRVEA